MKSHKDRNYKNVIHPPTKQALLFSHKEVRRERQNEDGTCIYLKHNYVGSLMRGLCCTFVGLFVSAHMFCMCML